MGDEFRCRREEPGIIGAGRDDHSPIAEGIFHTLGLIVGRKVVESDFHTLFLEHRGELAGGGKGIAVYGGTGHENALGFHSVAAPGVVEFEIRAEVALEHGPVEREDALYADSGQFLQERLHRAAVLPYYVEVVAAGFASPVIVFVGIETAALQAAELAEGICRKESSFSLFVAHHYLGPMHHRGEEEAQAVLSEFQDVTLLDSDRAPFQADSGEEVGNHLQGSFGGNHLKRRVLP